MSGKVSISFKLTHDFFTKPINIKGGSQDEWKKAARSPLNFQLFIFRVPRFRKCSKGYASNIIHNFSGDLKKGNFGKFSLKFN